MRHLQWFKGKSLDGFCPMGPVVVTRDEFGNPQTKRIATSCTHVVEESAHLPVTQVVGRNLRRGRDGPGPHVSGELVVLERHFLDESDHFFP